ncbi:MAG: LysR substrate-binding domain-containing protein, partial [bacterium]
MNLTQLRYFQELVRNRLVVSAAARALGTSQPAVSQQLRALEASLGTPLVLRNRNRLTGLTPVGEALVEGADQVLSEVARLEALGSAALAGGTEPLRVVSSHMQARFGLPQAIRAFHAIHPTVEVRVSHYVDEGGGPWRRIQNREADIAITSEVTGLPAGLMAIPCSPVGRVLIAPRGHPLLKRRTLSLADIAEWPLITVAERSIGRNRVVS